MTTPKSLGCNYYSDLSPLDTLLWKCIITTNKAARRQVPVNSFREPSVSARRLGRQRNPLRHVILAEVVHYYKRIGIRPLARIVRQQYMNCMVAKAGGTTRRPSSCKDRGVFF